MSDLVGNPEDRFSCRAAHITATCQMCNLGIITVIRRKMISVFTCMKKHCCIKPKSLYNSNTLNSKSETTVIAKIFFINMTLNFYIYIYIYICLIYCFTSKVNSCGHIETEEFHKNYLSIIIKYHQICTLSFLLQYYNQSSTDVTEGKLNEYLYYDPHMYHC